MEDVNIRELLTRKGWQVEESKENIQLRTRLDEMYTDHEELAKEWVIQNEQYERLKKKYSFLDSEIRQKDEQHQKVLEKIMQSQYETEEWKKKYQQQMKETKYLKKKLEESPPKLPKEPLQQTLSPLPAENSLLMLSRPKIIRHFATIGKSALEQKEPTTGSIKHLVPVPPSAKLPLSRKSIRGLMLKSKMHKAVVKVEMQYIPKPPKESAPPKAYHGHNRRISFAALKPTVAATSAFRER